MKIHGKMSDLTLQLTPYIYCHLVQFHKLFYASAAVQEADSQTITLSKIQSNATMRGSLEKQQTTIKFWNKHYAVLNNGFIFFFPEDDNQPL